MKRNFTLSLEHVLTGTGKESENIRKNNKRVSPRELVINNILNYSKSLTICHTRQTGIVNLVMN